MVGAVLGRKVGNEGWDRHERLSYCIACGGISPFQVSPWSYGVVVLDRDVPARMKEHAMQAAATIEWAEAIVFCLAELKTCRQCLP